MPKAALSLAGVTLAALLLGNAALAQSGPESATLARPAWGFNPDTRCPELHTADDGPRAVVRFKVSPYGTPSEVQIHTSSQSDALDAAAVKCVERLKFQPRTRLGDATPVESWQEIAWRWRVPPAPAPTAAAAVPAAGSATAEAARFPRAGASGPAVVRACTDAKGQIDGNPTLVTSSGNALIDEEALQIARESASYYGTKTPGGAGGCIRLSFGPESH
ncbi:MAG: TonB family protein [Proteobacteria bacterium]|nr:TonB family protein [Pseudomonadota bacterium]